MIRRLLVLAVLTVSVMWLLTRLVPAQEPLPVPPPIGPLPRDPAHVSSELLPDPLDAPPLVVERVPPRLASRGYLNDVGGAAAKLRRQVTALKNDITTDLRGPDRRDLSGQADDVLDALDLFEGRLKDGRPRAAVADDYALVESRVAALTREARAAGLGQTPAREGTHWVSMADERLAEAVAEGSPAAAWDPPLVIRESDNLVFVVRDLERQGEYALTALPGRRALQQDLHELTDAAEFFRASVAQASPRVRLMRDFRSVEEVWDRVAPAVADLTRDERLALVPRAGRVEDVIVRLHRRLGLAGAPAHLAAQAEPRQPVSPYGLVLPASAPR